MIADRVVLCRWDTWRFDLLFVDCAVERCEPFAPEGPFVERPAKKLESSARACMRLCSFPLSINGGEAIHCPWKRPTHEEIDTFEQFEAEVH